MGGNVKVKYGLHEYQGQPIPITKENVEFVKFEVDRLSYYFVSMLDTTDISCSGTTALLTKDHNLWVNELHEYISQIGDIDIMVPEESQGTLNLNVLEANDVIILGHKSIGKQDHYVTFGPLGFVQIDIRYVPFVDGKPTEFSVFSHSAPWLDIRKGFKGSVHKVALAIFARMRGYAFSVDYGLRKADAKKPYEYITDINEIYESLFFDSPDIIERELFESFIGLVELLSRHLTTAEKHDFLFQLENRLYGKDALNIPEEMKRNVLAYASYIFKHFIGYAE